MVNNFIINGLYYSAIFLPISGQAGVLSALGMSSIEFAGADLLSDLGGSNNAAGFDGGGTPDFIFPQGRNSSMYGVTDDLSITKGAHTFKMGVNFRRDDFSDYDAQEVTGGLASFGSLTDFVDGIRTTSTATSTSNSSLRLQGRPWRFTAWASISRMSIG